MMDAMSDESKEKTTQLGRLRATIARLRAPDGCPWDRAQTHRSICDCLMEECAELLDTIDRDDAPHMREELGDVLVNVLMHARMAEEAGQFDIEDVAREVNEKLIRRHPHVFAAGDAKTPDEVITRWDEIKKTERHNGPAAEGIFKYLPKALSALLSARALCKQIAKEKLPAEGAIDTAKIDALAQDLTEAKAGEALFEWVAACRRAGIDPESALRRHCARVKQAVAARVPQA